MEPETLTLLAEGWGRDSELLSHDLKLRRLMRERSLLGGVPWRQVPPVLSGLFRPCSSIRNKNFDL